MTGDSQLNSDAPQTWPKTTLVVAEQLSLLVLDVLEILAPKEPDARAALQARAQALLESIPEDQWMRTEALRTIADGKF